MAVFWVPAPCSLLAFSNVLEGHIVSIFRPEDGGSTSHQNVVDYTAKQPRRPPSTLKISQTPHGTQRKNLCIFQNIDFIKTATRYITTIIITTTTTIIIIIIINGAKAQRRALASLTGFVTVRYITMWVISPTITCSSHPDSTTRDI
jgi:hypothetical protein